MRTVLFVGVAPGYEEAVAAGLRRLPCVRQVARGLRGAFDLAVVIDTDCEGEVQRLMCNEIRLLSGVRSMERAEPAVPVAATPVAHDRVRPARLRILPVKTGVSIFSS